MFRFGRYTDVFYRHKLKPLLDELTSASANGERRCLWYTFPGFPAAVFAVSLGSGHL